MLSHLRSQGFRPGLNSVAPAGLRIFGNVLGPEACRVEVGGIGGVRFTSQGRGSFTPSADAEILIKSEAFGNARRAQRGAIRLQKIATALPEVWEIRPNIFRDTRGFFLESYNQAKFAAAGVTDIFVQDNHSCSAKGTLRGLHYQLHHAQAKLCRVVEGEALDVAVDVRLGSPTFGKWTSVRLSADTQNQIYIPRGFAHGFLALTERVQFLYKCSELYDALDEHAILWSDPEIGIPWNISAPLVSDKDRKAPTLAAIGRELLPVFGHT